MAKHCIHETSNFSALSNQKILDLTAEMTGMKLESDLKREVRGNILRLRDMGTYRGRRHAMGLPVRGQNTKSGQVSCALLITPFSRSFVVILTQFYRYIRQGKSTESTGKIETLLTATDEPHSTCHCVLEKGIGLHILHLATAFHDVGRQYSTCTTAHTSPHNYRRYGFQGDGDVGSESPILQFNKETTIWQVAVSSGHGNHA